MDHSCYFLCVFIMLSCASVYCLVVTCWERADLFALVCDVLLRVCYFPIGILGQVWYWIVSILDLCPLSYLENNLDDPWMNHQNMAASGWGQFSEFRPCFVIQYFCPYSFAIILMGMRTLVVFLMYCAL